MWAFNKSGSAPNISYEVVRGMVNSPEIDWTAVNVCQVVGVTIGANPTVTCNTNHGIYTGAPVTIAGVVGVSGINGTWYIKRIDNTHFSVPAATTTGTFDVMGSVGSTTTTKIISCYVVSASNTNPIAVGCQNAHGYVTGDSVTLHDISGNTAANGTFSVTVTGIKTFTIPAAGNGSFAATALANVTSATNATPVYATFDAGIGLPSGAAVIIAGNSNSGANGTWSAARKETSNENGGEDHMILIGSVGTSAGTGGTVGYGGVGYRNTQLRLVATHLSDANTNPPDAPTIWDAAADPKGLIGGHIATAKYDSSHYSCTDIACVGTTDIGLQAWAPMSAAAISTIATHYSPDAYTHFNWKVGIFSPNTVENYMSNNQLDVDPNDPTMQFAINSRPVWLNNPSQGEDTNFSLVGGTTSIYKMSAKSDTDTLWPYHNHKVLPMMAYSGWRPLLNVSSPTVAMTDGAGGNYTSCFALHGGECWTGSKPFEYYANVPNLNKVAPGKFSCFAIGNKDMNDVCIDVRHWLSDMGVQYVWGLRSDMGIGRHFRKLDNGFSTMKLGGYGQVPKVFTDGRWLGPLVSLWGANRVRTAAWYSKLPPVPPVDGINRLLWVPVPLKVGSIPAGASFAQVEFGYSDFSDPSNGKFYCAERRENCLAVSATYPKPYGVDDGLNGSTHPYSYGQVNLVADYYFVTAASPVTINIPGGHKLGADSKISVQGCGNSEITIVDSTHFSVNGSTTCQTVGAQPSVAWWRSDSPYLLASDGCAVTAVTVGSTTELRCVNEHHMQTGNRVCIAGTGITALNGCFAITYTGPAAFTVAVNTTGQTYTSGGTVAPGGEPCTSGCTVTVPAMSSRVMYYRWKYLKADGTLAATGRTETLSTP
jgi:hypothetical protein